MEGNKNRLEAPTACNALVRYKSWRSGLVDIHPFDARTTFNFQRIPLIECVLETFLWHSVMSPHPQFSLPRQIDIRASPITPGALDSCPFPGRELHAPKTSRARSSLFLSRIATLRSLPEPTDRQISFVPTQRAAWEPCRAGSARFG